MGWSFDSNTQGLTLTQLKQYVVNDLSQRDERFTLLDHGGAGEELYALLLNKETQEKVIQLTLMRNFDGEWGLKDIGDSSHPYYFNCPVRLLDQATTQDEDAVKWRQACYQQHNENKARKDFAANLQAGDLIATEDGGFSGQYVRKYNKTGSRIVCLGENNTLYQVRVSNLSVEQSNQLRETSAWAQANLAKGDTLLLLEPTGYGYVRPTSLTLESINSDGLTAVCINEDGEDDIIAWREVDKAATEQRLEQAEPSGYIVLHAGQDGSHTQEPLSFSCQAKSNAHAIRLFNEAFPNVEPLWVSQNAGREEDVDLIYQAYFAATDDKAIVHSLFQPKG